MHLRLLRRWGPLFGLMAVAALAIMALRSNSPTTAAATEPISDDLTLQVLQDGQIYTVGVYMLFDADSTEAQREESRAAMIARFPGASVDSGGVTAQFNLTGPKWDGATTTWAYNPAGRPDGLTGDTDALAAVETTWNEAGSPFTFSGAGLTSTSTNACSTARDSQNVVGWASQSGATLGVTCVWSKGSGASREFVEFDMEFDPDWDWTTSTQIVHTDFQSVALHEFGHALGLDHTQGSRCPGPVMCASYGDGNLLRTLQPDDLDALYAIYGQTQQSPTATPTARPTATPEPLPTQIGTRGRYRVIAPGATHQ